jgi:F-type H+-transporting ATPase subunit epsilon
MFVLNLVTPEKKLIADTEVDEVIVPGYSGQLDILPGHSPLITTLATGLVRYRVKGQMEYSTVVVSWGYCQIHPEGVVVLAETAESLEEIDRARAEASLKRVKTQLLEPILEADQMAKLQQRLARAQVRLEALGVSSDISH